MTQTDANYCGANFAQCCPFALQCTRPARECEGRGKRKREKEKEKAARGGAKSRFVSAEKLWPKMGLSFAHRAASGELNSSKLVGGNPFGLSTLFTEAKASSVFVCAPHTTQHLAQTSPFRPLGSAPPFGTPTGSGRPPACQCTATQPESAPHRNKKLPRRDWKGRN